MDSKKKEKYLKFYNINHNFMIKFGKLRQNNSKYAVIVKIPWAFVIDQVRDIWDDRKRQTQGRDRYQREANDIHHILLL